MKIVCGESPRAILEASRDGTAGENAPPTAGYRRGQEMHRRKLTTIHHTVYPDVHRRGRGKQARASAEQRIHSYFSFVRVLWLNSIFIFTLVHVTMPKIDKAAVRSADACSLAPSILPTP
eukprot:scpid35466/ scgid14517/ 